MCVFFPYVNQVSATLTSEWEKIKKKKVFLNVKYVKSYVKLCLIVIEKEKK